MKISLPDHPLFKPIVFSTSYSKQLSVIEYPKQVRDCLKNDFIAPLKTCDSIKNAIRELLRHTGFKPAGRAKPSSEYLLRSFQENSFPEVNIAVDTGNIVSLYSGIPLSVIDQSKVQEPFSICIGKSGENYQFNKSGQTIDIGGMLCFCDASGPCANPVKDSQRTKTYGTTTDTLTILWGSKTVSEQVAKAFEWYADLLSLCNVRIDRYV